MAWNPSPEVAPLRDYAKQFDRPIVVAFSIDRNGDQFHIATFGETKKLCKLAGSFGDSIATAVANGTIAAPELEPSGDVRSTSTWTRDKEQAGGE